MSADLQTDTHTYFSWLCELVVGSIRGSDISCRAYLHPLAQLSVSAQLQHSQYMWFPIDTAPIIAAQSQVSFGEWKGAHSKVFLIKEHSWAPFGPPIGRYCHCVAVQNGQITQLPGLFKILPPALWSLPEQCLNTQWAARPSNLPLPLFVPFMLWVR